MIQARSPVLDGTRRYPGLTEQISTALSRTAQNRVLSSSPGDRWDRIAAIVLCLLFDMTQQTARFGACADPWSHLAVYDVDGFAAFTREGAA